MYYIKSRVFLGTSDRQKSCGDSEGRKKEEERPMPATGSKQRAPGASSHRCRSRPKMEDSSAGSLQQDLSELQAVVGRLSVALQPGNGAGTDRARIERLNEAILLLEEERDNLRTKLKAEQERSSQLRRELEASQGFKELYSSLQRRCNDLQESLLARCCAWQRVRILYLYLLWLKNLNLAPLRSQRKDSGPAEEAHFYTSECDGYQNGRASHIAFIAITAGWREVRRALSG
jgi:hypothetical protein